MNYTLKSNYIDPRNSQFANNYPFVNYQNKRIYDEFDNFILFKPFYLTKLINENDHIDYQFIQIHVIPAKAVRQLFVQAKLQIIPIILTLQYLFGSQLKQ